MPPRLKDWTEGHTQIGLFIRDSEGSVIEVVTHKANDAVRKAAADILKNVLEIGAGRGSSAPAENEPPSPSD